MCPRVEGISVPATVILKVPPPGQAPNIWMQLHAQNPAWRFPLSWAAESQARAGPWAPSGHKETGTRSNKAVFSQSFLGRCHFVGISGR